MPSPYLPAPAALVDESQKVTPPWLLWFQWFGALFGGSPAKCIVQWGTGDPTGVIAAPVGSLWIATDGGVNTTLWVKEVGVDAAGWAAK